MQTLQRDSGAVSCGACAVQRTGMPACAASCTARLTSNVISWLLFSSVPSTSVTISLMARACTTNEL